MDLARPGKPTPEKPRNHAVETMYIVREKVTLPLVVELVETTYGLVSRLNGRKAQRLSWGFGNSSSLRSSLLPQRNGRNKAPELREPPLASLVTVPSETRTREKNPGNGFSSPIPGHGTRGPPGGRPRRCGTQQRNYSAAFVSTQLSGPRGRLKIG